MCGMDVDLDEGGTGDDERDQEDEFATAGEGVRMLPPPTAHCDGGVWGSRRGRCGCLAWGTGLLLWNITLVLACLLLMTVIFSLILMPAGLLLYAGFLCHSRVLASPSGLCRYLDDNSCSALIILGFVMMSPLVVVAAATFCGLLRRLRLLMLFQPITHAWYRGRGLGWGRDIRAWV
ncbi:transmembrane protein 88B [Chanos chanos]|uniref:Transmembrane protein 88B n=1 Tax=Chanos chanos TaxID=29144 RepID=A0A6J2VN31_CHACN|nr:transmembrane protein 88B [Chanos chanos]